MVEKDILPSPSPEKMKELLERQWKVEGVSNPFRKCKWSVGLFRIGGQQSLEDISNRQPFKRT